MSTFNRCPGLEQLKNLESFTCKCKCGALIEVFSDELEKKHKCARCGNEMDFSKMAACELEMQGHTLNP